MKRRKWLGLLLAAVMVLTMVPTMAFAAEPTDSSVNRIPDTDEWYGDMTNSFDTLEDYWGDIVESTPNDYIADAEAKTVSIGSAEALVWWAKQVNQGTSFAGYTVDITDDIDLSAHYWTPICTGTVTYSNGNYNIASNNVLENVIINGGGHTITGITTATGVRGPNQDSQPGDGQNCYYDAAFIGYSSCDITIQGLTFANARIAISDPFEEVTQKYGSSMIAVVVGAQNGGSLTLKNVIVNNANVLAMQKASAFVGNLMGGSTLSVERCEISDSTFSAYFMVAPIASYGSADQVTVKGIKLTNNTINIVEQASYEYSVNETTGAQYWGDDLNACTTALFYDGVSEYGNGTELTFAAELDGYLYTNADDAVHNAIKVEAKEPACTAEGNIEYWHCNDCGKYFSDAGCKTEITEADTIVSATGHDFEDGKCTVCDATITVEVAETPTIDTTAPAEAVQVGVDVINNTVDLVEEATTLVNDIINGETPSAVSKETADNIKAAVTGGAEVTVEITYDNDVVVSDAEKNIADAVIDANDTIAEYFDLSIIITADGKELGKLTQLSEPMAFIVAIPQDLMKDGREYFIIRIHDGKAEKLDTTMNDDGTLTFETDRFSTYALGYSDPVAQVPGDDTTGGNGNVNTGDNITAGGNNDEKPSADAKDPAYATGDDSNIAIPLAAAGLALAAMATVVATRRRHS